MTIRDMAKRIGVSPATVSLVLNNKPGLSEQTRMKVKKALVSLGVSLEQYAPTIQKSMLFVVYRKHGADRRHTPFFPQVYSQIIEGVEWKARLLGFSIKIIYLDENNFSQQAEYLTKMEYEGMLILATELDKNQIALLETGKPLVLLDTYIEDCVHPAVIIHNESGVMQAVVHLRNLGHSRIGYLHIIHNANNFMERYYGFLRAMDQHGLQPKPEDICQISTNEGGEAVYEVLKQYFESHPDCPTAFFADNDIIASYALKVCKHLRIRVPEDLSIIGFDNIGLAELLDPPLTTIDTPKYDLGQSAVALLDEYIRQPVSKQGIAKIVALKPSLVVRSSTHPFSEE